MKKFTVALSAAGIFLFGGLFANDVSAEEHEVTENDTLWQIAESYGTSVDQLMEVNQLDSDIIVPGQVIETDKADKEAVYTVQKGDTLSEIALNHDMTTKELKKMNDLSDSLIITGDKLTVKVNTEEAPETQVDEAETADNKANETEAQASEETSSNEASAEEPAEQAPAGETISMTATAYTAECDGCSGITATGIDIGNNPDKKVVAVDPDVIPLGSTVYVEGYGEAIAGDTGGAIKGNKIDIHVPTKAEASEWGVQTVNVTVLN